MAAASGTAEQNASGDAAADGRGDGGVAAAGDADVVDAVDADAGYSDAAVTGAAVERNAAADTGGVAIVARERRWKRSFVCESGHGPDPLALCLSEPPSC